MTEERCKDIEVVLVAMWHSRSRMCDNDPADWRRETCQCDVCEGWRAIKRIVDRLNSEEGCKR